MSYRHRMKIPGTMAYTPLVASFGRGWMNNGIGRCLLQQPPLVEQLDAANRPGAVPPH